MISKPSNLLPALGFLRLALLISALLNMVLPLVEILVPLTTGDDKHHLWSVLTSVIAPVIAPLLVVLFWVPYFILKL
jgi:hypothetical protein